MPLITYKYSKSTEFNDLEEMQKNLSQGIVGRVLVDRNTAFHFLDKSGLKRNRQIRLIRNIEYPLDYYLAHVSKEVPPTPFMLPNDTDISDTETLAERKMQLAECGPMLEELSVDLVGVAKTTAEEQLIPAELQVNLWYIFLPKKFFWNCFLALLPNWNPQYLINPNVEGLSNVHPFFSIKTLIDDGSSLVLRFLFSRPPRSPGTMETRL